MAKGGEAAWEAVKGSRPTLKAKRAQKPSKTTLVGKVEIAAKVPEAKTEGVSVYYCKKSNLKRAFFNVSKSAPFFANRYISRRKKPQSLRSRHSQ